MAQSLGSMMDFLMQIGETMWGRARVPMKSARQ